MQNGRIQEIPELNKKIPESVKKESKKRVLRKEALFRRDMLSEADRAQKSRTITQALLAHSWYRDAGMLLVYASYRSEVSTQEIICHALRNGKRVYCPVVTDKREMTFCSLDAPLSNEVLRCGIAALKPGSFGIPEPDASVCAHYQYRPDQSLMLMPGCVFDDYGNRIGYGGGFYDRYLAGKPMRTIALFFDCQHSDMPIGGEKHDVRPNLILTESGWRMCDNGTKDGTNTENKG